MAGIMAKPMPCGKMDCSECESCKYDLPLDAPLNNINRTDMKNFGIIPMDSNPSTSQIILPSKRLAPVGSETQLTLPLKEDKNECIPDFCNECPHYIRTQIGNKTTYNARCTKMAPITPGSYRVIKLSVFPQQKVHKPFWCPLVKNSVTKSLNKSLSVGNLILPRENRSMLSDTQLRDWERIKEEKRKKDIWLGMSGITSWDDIKIGHIYHLPPTMKKNRMNIKIKTKYQSSIEAINVVNNERLWLYKNDEEYKFLSEIQ